MIDSLKRVLVVLFALVSYLVAGNAFAWGENGHEIVVLIAAHYLKPAVEKKIEALLVSDPSTLTAHDLASEANWADRFRNSDRSETRTHFNQTQSWHYVNIELASPDLDAACFGHPPLPKGVPASEGPAQACVVDKLDEFITEWRSPTASPDERRLALQFLLHLVADLHQPLHASDDHDGGGNEKRVLAKGFKAGKLHHYWDTEFVQRLGMDPEIVAHDLIGNITKAQRKQWQEGGPADWAWESFQLAKAVAYSGLPEPDAKGRYQLGPTYVHIASDTVVEQLSKAGVRLAWILNSVAKPAH